MPFDPMVKRTEGTIEEKGVTYKTTKGAPHVLLKLCDNHEVSFRASLKKLKIYIH